MTVGFYSLAVFAFFLLTDRTGTAAMFFFAVALHELGHFLLLRASRARITGITVTLGAVGIAAQPRRETQSFRLLLSFSGCAVNALLALLFGLTARQGWMIRFSAVNAAVCAVNLLPIEGTDGGTALAVLLCAVFGERTGLCAGRVISAVLACAALGAVAFTVWRRGLYLWGLAALAVALLRLFAGEVE